MSLRPTTRLVLAVRAARRRRYAYAALRVLRRGLAAAVEAHIAASVGARPYATELGRIRALYVLGLGELRARFGRIPFDDERADP